MTEVPKCATTPQASLGFDLFICYRRDLSAMDAVHLYQRLFAEFGDTVFIDHECLIGGEIWRDRIDAVLGEATVVIVVLGAGWLEGIEKRFLEQQPDEVLRELTVALDQGKPLFSVLVEDAPAATTANVARLPTESAARKVIQALAAGHVRRWRSVSSAADLRTIIEELSAYVPRFGVRLVHRCQTRLAAQLRGEVGPTPLPMKFGPFATAVPREKLQRKLSVCMNRKDSLLVIHAEEGMGKTIALGWALQGCNELPVVLVHAGDPLWRQGFRGAVEAILTTGRSDPVGDDTPSLRRLVSDTELPMALQQPLLIAIDGLNEAHSIDWGSMLNEALAITEREYPWRVVVTVRTEHWRHQILPKLTHRPVLQLEVLPLEEPEFIALADQLGFRWQEVRDQRVLKQLRRPRMLAAAAAIPPEQLRGMELSYPLLMLLDLKNRGTRYQHLTIEDFSRVLQLVGKQATVGLKRSELRDLLGVLSDDSFERGLEELGDAGVLRRDGGLLCAHEGATGVAMGLHLLATLRGLGIGDHAALGEQIAKYLADRQDDAAGRSVSHALVAGVVDRVCGDLGPLDQHDPVLAALFADWERRFNKSYEPAQLARLLLPELLWLAEHASYRHNPVGLIADAVRASLPAAWRAQFNDRLDRWFTGIDLSAEGWTGPPDPRRIAERRMRFEQSKALARLREVASTESGLRRLALDLAARCELDPNDLELLDVIVSVAVQPAIGWDPFIKWVRSAAFDWWPALERTWQRICAVDPGTELKESIARLLYALWPTPECTQGVSPSPHRHAPRPIFRGVPNWQAPTRADHVLDEESLKILHKRVDANAFEPADEELAALALWSRGRLDRIIADLVDRACTEAEPLRFAGIALARLAPLLVSAQARRLRALVAGKAEIEQTQRAYLSLASWWSLPEVRRTCAVSHHMRELDLPSDVLAAAPIPASAASCLIRRIRSKRRREQAPRLAFWLYLALDQENEDSVRNELAKQLPIFKAGALVETTEYWFLRLVLRVGLAADAVHLIPADWRYQPDNDFIIRSRNARSAILAESGTLTATELHKRCHIGHWELAEEPDRSRFIVELAARVQTDFLSTEYRPGSLSNHSAYWLKKAVEQDSGLVDRTLDCTDYWRRSRAQDLAAAIEPTDHDRWIELAERMLEQRSSHGRTINDIDERYLIAFKAPDDERARLIWDKLLGDVEHDAELLQLVVAAQKGQGQTWLEPQSRIDPSALPHHQLRAATIAGMMGNPAQRYAIDAASKSYGGWIAKGFERAIELYQSDEIAQAWYQRFRLAENWYEAYGSWRMHCECLDLRHQLWDRKSMPPHALSDAERYEAAFWDDVQHARQRRRDQLRKTRFGMDC